MSCCLIAKSSGVFVMRCGFCCSRCGGELMLSYIRVVYTFLLLIHGESATLSDTSYNIQVARTEDRVQATG